MIKFFRKLSKTYIVMISFLVGFSIVLSVTYAVFTNTSSSYKASEMFVADLTYGITINNTATNTITLTEKGVTYYDIKIANLTAIDTKYKLVYTTESEYITVKKSSISPWKASGTTDQYGNDLYEKTIRVVVVNSDLETATVRFSVEGGYTHNSINSIDIEGYTAITSTYNEHLSYSVSSLTGAEKVASIFSCTPTSTHPCLYTNEMESNYVSYSGYIWRIMGTYLIDNTKVLKLVLNTNYGSNVTYSNIGTTLTTFYNALTDKSTYVLTNTDFQCTNSSALTCTSNANYTNIGLINKDEYTAIGGINSYLNPENSYWTMTESNSSTYEITTTGSSLKEQSSSSGVRPVIYIKQDIELSGNGTESSPYTLTQHQSYDTSIAMTLDGVSISSFDNVTTGYYLTGSSCNNNSTASWDPITKSVTISPFSKDETECLLSFTSTPYLYDIITHSVAYPDDTNSTYVTLNTGIDFSAVSSDTNGKGLYYTADAAEYGEDNTRIYYYRGDVDNNWVNLGGYKWRIVRSTAEGGVKLVYAGAGSTTTDGFIGTTTTAYNSSMIYKYYVGYTYNTNSYTGAQTNSIVKGVVDTWYSGSESNYLGTNYGNYFSNTAVYCNDRSAELNSSGNTWTSGDVYYPAYNRLVINLRPTYACSSTNASRYTVTENTTTGDNGYLTYPVGLLSADEISYAGLRYNGAGTTTAYIMDNATGANWWTSSPIQYYYVMPENKVVYHATVGNVGSTGALNHIDLSGSGRVRPATSLKSCVTVTGGDGTYADPYTLSSSSC